MNLNFYSPEMVLYANGGHNPPVKIGLDGSVVTLPRTEGIALGIMEGVEFEEGQTTLCPGDLLYLFTDGMSDAQNQDQVFYTEEALMAFLGTLTQVAPASVVNSVYKAVTDFVDTGA